MRLGADRLQIEFFRQQVIAGTDQIREMLFQFSDNGFLNIKRETAAGTEIHQFKAAEVDPCLLCILIKVRHQLTQTDNGIFRRDLR